MVPVARLVSVCGERDTEWKLEEEEEAAAAEEEEIRLEEIGRLSFEGLNLGARESGRSLNLLIWPRRASRTCKIGRQLSVAKRRGAGERLAWRY